LQIRIEGTWKRLSAEEETRYFESSSIAAQVRSVVVQTGAVVLDRERLESEALQLYHKATKENYKIPKPDNVAGFALTPTKMDFYVGSAQQIGERVCYYRKAVESGQQPHDTNQAHVWFNEIMAD